MKVKFKNIFQIYMMGFSSSNIKKGEKNDRKDILHCKKFCSVKIRLEKKEVYKILDETACNYKGKLIIIVLCFNCFFTI